MTEKVLVEFHIENRQKFEDKLKSAFYDDDNVPGLRTALDPRRLLLSEFADKMEEKLKKNEHKTHWRDLPIEALVRFLEIELEEFKVAYEFLTAADARRELVDIANYSLICWDRLGLEPQDKNIHEQQVLQKEGDK